MNSYPPQDLVNRAIELIQAERRQPPLFARLIRRAALYAGTIIALTLTAYIVGLYLGAS